MTSEIKTPSNSTDGNNGHEPPNDRGFNITKWSIEHPYTIASFYMAMVLLAFIAIGFFMPKRMMPYVESPLVGIVTMQPGLSAEEMELYISKPIEERMVDIRGVRYIPQPENTPPWSVPQGVPGAAFGCLTPCRRLTCGI